MIRRSTTVLVTLAAICLALPTTTAQAPGPGTRQERVLASMSVRELMTRGVGTFRRGGVAGAITLFREVLRREPDHVDALYALSFLLERSGELDEAIDCAVRAIELGYTREADSAYRVAGLQLRAGRPEAALTWLRHALEAGYDDRPSIAGDETFAALRDDARFRELAAIPPADLSRDDGWRFDLDHLVEEARRLHAGPDRPALGAAFAERAAAIRESIPESTDEQVAVALMRLIAMLDDGHSAIYGPDPESPAAIDPSGLPLSFYLFPEGLYVVGGAGEASALTGSRVVRFGSVDALEVLERLAGLRGVDNPMTWRWLGPQFYLGRLAMLRAAGVETPDGAVELTLADRDGTERRERLAGGEHRLPRALPAFTAAGGEAPRWLRRVDEPYWMEPLPAARALYVQLNRIRDGRGETLAAFAGRLGDALRRMNLQHVILDVRHNSGGNNTLLRPLVRELVGFDVADDAHRIVVLTGRGTFSAAQNLINRLERMTDAEFAGERSSSRPNFVGEETNVLLPWSRLRGSISNRYWQDSDPGDERAWIELDYPVELTVEDWIAGRDPVLRTVLDELTREPVGSP